MSDSNRTRNIWNRILITLPQLYKTKGTEECVRLILSCHGIPTDLISVKEYGNVDYSSGTKVSNIQNEKIFMINWTRNNSTMEVPFPHKTKTLEFKFSFNTSQYSTNEEIPVVSYYPYPYTTGGGFWQMYFKKDRKKYDGQAIFRLYQSGSYSSDSGSQMPYVELTSSVMPIFSGDIFSVMLRRNYSSSFFSTGSILEDSVPIKYDLHVQRNESGRQIFRSTSSFYVSGSYNKAFSDISKPLKNFLAIGNWPVWRNGTSIGNNFDGTLDKIRLWRVPIDDGDFEDHVNDVNSYSWASSSAAAPLYNNLYFISDVHYPIDLSNAEYITGSMSGSLGAAWFPNASEYYQTTSSWGYSGSFYTGSIPSSSFNKISWIPFNDNNIASGSSVMYYGGLWQNVSHSLSSSGCAYVTHSVYPYQYKEFNVNQTYTIGTYGPNKFKNNKIKKYEQNLEVRLDDRYSSTSPKDVLVSSDSNLFGFFIDPQDFRNKDSIRNFGNRGILKTISSPISLYSSSYDDLTDIRNRYVKAGGKQVLFNELISLNKYYFDKSIFSIIKNLAPARANTLTGVLIEPSILERPKYQHKVIYSELRADTENMGVLTDINTLGTEQMWINFNTDVSTASVARAYPDSYYDFINQKNHLASGNSLEAPLWYGDLIGKGEIILYKGFEYLLDDYNKLLWNESLPPNYDEVIDVTYIAEPNSVYPINYGGSYINDLSDNYQLGWFSDREGQYRNDSVVVNGVNPKGATLYKNEGNHPSGSSVYYLMKRWVKYDIYTKSGSYVHDDNPKNDFYDTSSVYLYDIIHVNESFYKSLVYMTANDNREVTDLSKIYESGYGYHHLPSTFVSTSNDIRSNIKASSIPNFGPTDLSFHIDTTNGEYYEIFSGYPRNHYTHKMQWMSPVKIQSTNTTGTGSVFVKGKQTIDTTIGKNGLNNNSLPITSIDVSDVNVVKVDNVLN